MNTLKWYDIYSYSSYESLTKYRGAPPPIRTLIHISLYIYIHLEWKLVFVTTEECRGNITTHVSKYICQYCQFLTKRTQPKHNILLIVVTIIKTAISVIDNFISPTHSELKRIACFHTRIDAYTRIILVILSHLSIKLQ